MARSAPRQLVLLFRAVASPRRVTLEERRLLLNGLALLLLFAVDDLLENLLVATCCLLYLVGAEFGAEVELRVFLLELHGLQVVDG